MFSFLTLYLTWIKVGLAVIVLSIAIGGTHHLDKTYYEGVIAKTEAARAEAVNRQLVTRNNFMIEKNKIKEAANEVQQKNNVIVSDLNRKLIRMHLDFTTASSDARLLRDALHASGSTSSGVLPVGSNQSVSGIPEHTEESSCETRVKELLLDADSQNVDAIRLNTQIKPIDSKQ